MVRLIPSFRRQTCPLLTGDPAAEPVLRQLSEHPDRHVRRLACVGLRAIPAPAPYTDVELLMCCR